MRNTFLSENMPSTVFCKHRNKLCNSTISSKYCCYCETDVCCINVKYGLAFYFRVFVWASSGNFLQDHSQLKMAPIQELSRQNLIDFVLFDYDEIKNTRDQTCDIIIKARVNRPRNVSCNYR